MHIGIDIDSVIAEIIPPLFQFNNDVYKTNLKKHHQITYDLSPRLKISPDLVIKRIYEFYDSKYFDLIKPVKGSKKGIRELSKRHRLSAITSRPHYIEQKTINWLETYFPKQFSSIYHTNQVSPPTAPKKKKSQVGKSLGIDLFIDDHLDFVFDVASLGIPILLFNQPWNQLQILPKGITRVYSWEEIIKLLA